MKTKKGFWRYHCAAGLLAVVWMGAASAQTLSLASDPSELAKAALSSDRGLAAVGVWREGKAAYGLAQNDAPLPSAEGPPLFEVGSISKVFTGLLLAQAVERGELSLDDNLGQLLAGKASLMPAVAAITLRQLVTHNSCLPRLPADFRVNSSRPNPYSDYDRARMWATLATLKLDQPPPCAPAYSNLGFGVLGELLSERYGKPWDVLVREQITAPLGMNDTVQHLGDKASRLATPFEGRQAVSVWDFQAFAGAGALRSTTADMLLFSRALLAGRTGPLGAAAERLFTPLGDFGGARIGYAMVIRERDGRRTYLHDGGTGGYRSSWMLAPDTGEALIVLTSNAEVDWGRIGGLVAAYRYPVSNQVIPLESAQLAEYSGSFRVDKDLSFAFLVQDDTLYVRLGAQAFQPVRPVGGDTFTREETGLQFRFTRVAGRASGVVYSRGGASFTASRTDEAVPAWVLQPAVALQPYVGRYRLRSGAEFDVRAQNGQLTAKLPGQPRFTVFSVAGQADRFAYVSVKAELQFERFPSGEVRALVLHQNGAQMAPRVAD